MWPRPPDGDPWYTSIYAQALHVVFHTRLNLSIFFSIPMPLCGSVYLVILDFITGFVLKCNQDL
jgi:hypothetical protein